MTEAELAAVRRHVRMAARAMDRHGLVHAYGHVSARLDDRRFLATPACPLGAVGADDPCLVLDLDGELPEAALPELRIHREIYRARADVGGVCRVQPPNVMALSALGRTPRALHGLGAYFWPEPPLWSDTALVRSDDGARGVARNLGAAWAIVLRGNGAVTVGPSLMHAAAHAFFLEDAARVEMALLPVSAQARPYAEQEASARAVGTGRLYERMWDHLCASDPESASR